MDAVEDFSSELAELEELVSSNSCLVIYRKVVDLRKQWTIFATHHKELVEELEILKSRPMRNEELKLITTCPVIGGRPYQYESRENIFDDSINKTELECQPEDFDLSIMSSDLRSSYSSLPMSPPTTPTLSCTRDSPGTPGTRVMDITRQKSSLSTSSSSPSLTSGYTSSSPTFSLNSDCVMRCNTIRQRGHEKKFEMFQEILHLPLLENVTCFLLSFIEVETRVLFDTLERCTSIHHLEFMWVIFMGPFNRHIELPHLKTFLLNCCTSSTKKYCESKNLTQDDFYNSLFFAHWEKNDPIQPSVRRVELIVDGWTQLKLDYETGEFVSRLPFAIDFLDRVKSRFILRRLALQACKFNYDSYENFHNLTYLSLQSILTSSQDLVKVLHQCENLQELRFKNYIGSGIQLKDIPSRKLKFLCLGLCIYTLCIKYSPGVRFENLDTLIFPTSIMDNDILNNIPAIFKTKKVLVYLCSSGARGRCCGYFILHQLLQIESIESIWVSNFRRCIPSPSASTHDEYQLELYEEYEEFLLSAGLNNLMSTSFILEKKEVSPSTLVRSDDGKRYKWIGRDVSKEEHQVLEFQNRDGFKFSSWEAYMKRY